MKILVDTSIWSMALRRPVVAANKYVEELGLLIEEMHVQMIGPIRQELLSGIKSAEQYLKLKHLLASFPDLLIQPEDYEKAAKFFNTCRCNGLQGSNTDFLICAISVNHKMPIFTSDRDFTYFQKHLAVELHKLRENGN